MTVPSLTSLALVKLYQLKVPLSTVVGRPSALLGSLGAAELNHEDESNNDHDINGSGNIEKFNKWAIHRNLSSNLEASSMVTIVKDSEYVKRISAPVSVLTPNTPGKTAIEANHSRIPNPKG